MAGQTTTLIGVSGTVAAAMAGGPISEVFNELGLAMAIMGGLGGVTLGITNRYPWRGVLRGGLLGSLMAFGFGIMSPVLLEWAFDLKIEASDVSAMAAGAFAIGFVQEILVSWLQKRGDKK